MSEGIDTRPSRTASPSSGRENGTAPVIQLDGVSFSHEGVGVLEAVDLRVNERDFLSVVGPNGGGKTTLIKLILGLLKPSAGTVRVLGASPEKARRHIGYLPQYVHYDPLFPVTVRDVVLMGRLGEDHKRAGFGAEDRRAADTALEQAGVADLRERPFRALSGGERQRVLLARALSAEPRLLLLDEPTSNVDAAAEQKLFETLEVLNRTMTILLVSHDIGVVSQVVSGVICVKRTVRVHPTTELTGDLVRELYGGEMRMVHHDQCCGIGGGNG